MAENSQSSSQVGRVFGWVTLLTVLYVLSVFLLPYQKHIGHSYHLSTLEYRIAVLMVSLPEIVVWFVSFWGYHKLKQYAVAIKDTPEGEHFQKLALGATWLAWTLPIGSIAGRILSSIGVADHTLNSVAVIVDNYVGLILPLIAFLIISAASRGLMGSLKLNLKLQSIRLIMVLFIAGGVIYCYLTLKAFDLSSLGSTHNHYHLPAWLMVVSVIIPYLYSWFIGVLAAYEISVYARNVKGLFYRRALYNITFGLISIVLSFVATQYIQSVWLSPGRLVFDSRLIVITAFRIIGGIGFFVIAYGANQLKKIEEV